jgi:signal transduction histidine kinase
MKPASEGRTLLARGRMAGPRARTSRDRLAPLVQASRLDELMTLAVRTAQDQAFAANGFLVLSDPLTQELDPATARMGTGAAPRLALLRSLLSGNGLLPRLTHGVHVFQQPSGAAGPGWLILPLVLDSTLQGALALEIPAGVPVLSRTLESLRELCQQIAPLLARLREMEALRQTIGALTAMVYEGAQYEVRLRELQDQMRELRSIETLRRALIAGVNHALRTPLVAIRGYTRLLLQSGQTTFSEEERHHLEVIARNTDRLVDATRNLWLPEKTQLRLTGVDLGALWARAVPAAREKAAARNVSLIDGAPDAPVTLVGDGPKLEHMLADVLAGAVALATAGQELRADLSQDPARITMTFRQGGPPATAASSAEDDAGSGAWLWLDAAREAANCHGGRISALREPGGGLTIAVVLPRVRMDA